MGHTLVARFDEKGIERLHTMMRPFNAGKIPFGRDCDRDAANAEMDYHVTLVHWSKAQDAHYLRRVQELKPSVCRVTVTGTQMIPAEEGSMLLYLDVLPSQGFQEMAQSIERCMRTGLSGFLHITLAVSRDADEIRSIDRHLQETVRFPFELTIAGFDLYHIWRPTKKVRSW